MVPVYKHRNNQKKLYSAGLCLGDWASQILFNASSSWQFLTQGIAGTARSWFDLADASMSTPCTPLQARMSGISADAQILFLW